MYICEIKTNNHRHNTVIPSGGQITERISNNIKAMNCNIDLTLSSC